MPEFLELAHLVNKNGMTDVQVRCGRIEAGFDNERLAFLQFCFQAAFREHFFRSTDKFLQLLLCIRHYLYCARQMQPNFSILFKAMTYNTFL